MEVYAFCIKHINLYHSAFKSQCCCSWLDLYPFLNTPACTCTERIFPFIHKELLLTGQWKSVWLIKVKWTCNRGKFIHRVHPKTSFRGSTLKGARHEIFTAVTININVFWDMTMSSVTDGFLVHQIHIHILEKGDLYTKNCLPNLNLIHISSVLSLF